MNQLMKSCLLVVGLTLACASTARAQEYRSGRVSDLRGNLAVRGEQEDDVSYLERNSVIREGDTLWTDDDGRAEIELERGSWIRLAEGTKLEIKNLPPSGDFRLWTGSVYFDVSERIESPIRLKTPVGDVEVEPDSVVRVDLGQTLSARVSVWNGRARVYPERGSSLRVAIGERVYLEADRPLEDPKRFDRNDLDGLDRYHRDRVDYYISRPLPRELEREVLGARDLNDYGSWVVVENVNYWRPRCEPGWRPYSAGYWSWMPGFGYTWIDYQPWGYATSHYGGWVYRPVYGWLWSPGYAWSPAYVSWGRYGNYYGWCPLDPWGRPSYFPGSGFSLAFGTGNFFIDFRSWTFCDSDRFYYGRHHWRQWPDFDRRGRRQFFSANDLGAKRFGFSLVGDAARDFGAPRSQVRGLTFGGDGKLARDRVLDFERRKLPATGLKRIENRFGVPADRDRQFAQRPSELPDLQRGTGLKIGDNHLVRGDDASRRLFQPGRPNGFAGGNDGNRPNPFTPQPGGNDNNDRTRPGLGTPRPGDRPDDKPERPGLGIKPGDQPGDRGERPGLGVKPGDNPANPGDRPGFGNKPGNQPGNESKPGDRPGLGTRPGEQPGDRPDNSKGGDRPGFRPREGSNGDGTPGGPKAGNPPGDRPGFQPGNGPGFRPGESQPDRTGFKPGERPGDRGERPGFGPGSNPNSNDRDSPFRRGGGSTSPGGSPDRGGDKRPGFQPSPRNDNSRPSSQPRENPSRRTEPERRAPERDAGKSRKASEFGGDNDRQFGLTNPTPGVTPDRTANPGASPRSDSPFRRGESTAGGGSPFGRTPEVRGAEPAVTGGDERIRKPDAPKPGGAFQDFRVPTTRPVVPSGPANRDNGFRRGNDNGGSVGGGNLGGSNRSPFGSSPDRSPAYDRTAPSYDRGGSSRPSYTPTPAPSRNYDNGNNRGSFGGSSSRSYSAPAGGSSYNGGSFGGSRSYSAPSGGGFGGGRSYSSPSSGSFGGGRSSGSFSNRSSYGSSRSSGSLGGRSYGSSSSSRGSSGNRGSFGGGRSGR